MRLLSKNKTRLGVVLSVGALCLTSLIADLQAGPTAWTQIKNNNHIIEKQKADDGNPMKEGEVTIDFYGHAAFKMTSPGGLTLLFDPWRNDPSGAWYLSVCRCQSHGTCRQTSMRSTGLV